MPLVHQAMILTKDGLLLLDYKFRGGTGALNKSDPDLVSGLLSAILSVSKETSGGVVETIQQDRYKVVVSEGEFVYVLLFIDEESRELELVAKRIVNKFEKQFADHLDNFITDVDVFKAFADELEEMISQTFEVDAEILSRIIPAVTPIKNVLIFEKPMNHQVYAGPRDSFVSQHEHAFQEMAVSIIETQEKFSEKTLQFPKRSIFVYNTRVAILEDLGSHVLMIIGDNESQLLNTIKKIRKKADI